MRPWTARRRTGCRGETEVALAEPQVLKLLARLKDLTVWRMEKVKQRRKVSKSYTYWVASWRERGKTRNMHLESSRKMDSAAAKRKVKAMKGGSAGLP